MAAHVANTESKRILVVEDERIAAHELEQSLRGFGYHVLAIASSYDDALRVAESEVPDLVMMDIRLKGDKDGIEAAELLKTRFDVPVIYLTASSDEDSLGRAKATAPYGYLLKPVKTVELRSAVEIALYKHQHERQVRERWFSAVLRSIGEGVIATGVDGRISFMNQVAERLTGYRSGESSERAIEEVFSTVDEKTRLPKTNPLLRALRDGVAVALSNHTLLVRRDGTTVPIDDSAAPVVDEDGKLLGAVLVFRDATERQQLQSNLLVADRMVSMGMLAAGVAHEVNNPLASVMANVELADRDIADLERRLGQTSDLTDIREALSDAREGSDRIRQIVRDLKIFSRSEEERRTLVDIRHVIESTLRLAWNEVRHRARLVKDYGKTPQVEASEARLGQAFLNLLINAAQAIPEGRADSNEIRITTSTDAKGNAVIEITDTGEGMSPEVLGRLFQPFFTTKPVGMGTGLGLSLCRRILTDVGGTIAIRSTLGEGTSVSVVLPPKSANAAPTRTSVRTDSATRSMKPPRRARVLVVDDEPQVAKVLTRALAADHEVTSLLHAEEALVRIDGGERFDVIFCDLMMPQMTGMDFFERLAATCPDQAAKMVFVTGGVFTPRGRQFLDDVPNLRIEKPFDFRQIIALVNERIR